MFRRLQTSLLALLVLPAAVMVSQPALAQFAQQGSKLIGTGTVGLAEQGYSVAISSDGSTAIVGGITDNSGVGAAWVYTVSGGVWTQQGSKLVGSPGSVSSQGRSVALSADGNTAIVGGTADGGSIGAAWVFTRSGGAWTQQAKLVGTGNAGISTQGHAVALSADGNTALVGGPDDNSSTGAVWVFTRSGSTWTQQGLKLVGTGGVGGSNQGFSVALSSDGNTALVGGYADNGYAGAIWVFTRSGTSWTQQGNKLFGSGNVGVAGQGYSVSLSGDGKTAVEGGILDNAQTGATWVFTQSGGVWSQVGTKLVGIPFVGVEQQGTSVSLSSDGSTLAVGGPTDTSYLGAVWIFMNSGGVWGQYGQKIVGTGGVQNPYVTQGDAVALSANGQTLVSGGYHDNSSTGAAWIFALHVPHDFNGDAKSDILLRDAAGDVAMWLMNGGTVTSAVAVGTVPAVWSVVGQRDFDGDGKADLLWRDTTGDSAIWFMNGGTVTSAAALASVPSNWSVVGTGDFNNDGMGDILWRDTAGDVAVWLMSGSTAISGGSLGNIPTNWSVAGSSGNVVVWRDTAGDVAYWKLNGTTLTSSVSLGNVPTSWSIVGTGDFDGDGNIDILWRDTSGNVAIWLMNSSSQVSSSVFVGNVPTVWSVAETGDFNHDGKSDILWTDTSGDVAIWEMSGGTVLSSQFVGTLPATWSIVGANAD